MKSAASTSTRPPRPSLRMDPTGKLNCPRTRVQRAADKIFANFTLGAGAIIFLTLALVAVFLSLQSWPAIQASTEVRGRAGEFSLLAEAAPLVFGTVLAALLALLLAVPVAVGIALYISHYAPRILAQPLSYLVDLLAAVPSVVFGLWGGAWLVPELAPIFMALHKHLGWIPLFAGNVTAPMRNLAAAAIVLAVMILPIITAVSREVFLQTSKLEEEAALALGATRWEMIRLAVLPAGKRGVLSASMLGLGRALGETMAVLMVLSAGNTFSFHILEVGMHNTIAANIAAQSAESSGLAMSRLVFTGLVLFVLTFVINSFARGIVDRSGK